MSAGTQISDMTVTPTCPTGSYAPVVVLTSATGLDPETSYIFDVGAAFAARPTSAALAANGGAALIGTSDSITVQAALTARPTSATLAAAGGSALIGFEAAGAGAVARTEQDKLRDWVSVLDYPTLQAAYDSLPSTGGTVIIPDGYTETLAANLTLDKDFCGFATMGRCTITMGSNQVIVNVGIIGAFITSFGALSGGDHNVGVPASGGGCWIYTGNSNAFVVGGATFDTEKFHLENQSIYIATGGVSATGLYIKQTTFSRIINVTVRGSSTQTVGGVVFDGTGSDSGYNGFINLSGLTVVSCAKGIVFNGFNSDITGQSMSVLGPLTAGSVGLDFVGTPIAGIFLQCNVTTFETGVRFAASANLVNTHVLSYNENNTTDVAFGLGCLRNTFTGVGEYPVASTDANGVSSTNNIIAGNEANRTFFPNGGYVAFRTAAGLLSRSIYLDSGDIFYTGLIDQAIAAWVVRSGAAIWTQMDAAIVQTLGKVAPGTPAGALQSDTGIYAGSGAPNNANGSNGDFYLRSDGTAAGNTVIYHKEAGSWVALTT